MAQQKNGNGNSGSFADLLKDYAMKIPTAGETVKGTVIAVENGAMRLDINGIMTGVVRGEELFGESREYGQLKIGDEVEAIVLEQENENGEMELSFRIAGNQRVWDTMDQYRKDNITITAKILQANKGGLMVQVDALTGFMPVSQLSPDHYPRVPGGDKNRILEQLQRLIGQEFQVKVLDVNQRDEKLIVSEKAVWEDEQKTVLESYKIGDTVDGEVSALTSFGAFMKFGQGLEGLIHISEIVWQRIDHPRDVLKVGDRVKAQIIDLNKSKIYLSMKRLIDDPWKVVKDKYHTGDIVEGEIHKVEHFGLMVKLDDQIHGLAHISEVADKPLTEKELRDEFKIGEKRRFEVLNIEPAEHRLALKLEGVKGRRRVEKSLDATQDKKEETSSEEKSAEEKKEE